jgi:hypothetical protein
VLPSPVRILGDVLPRSTAILAHYPSNKTSILFGMTIREGGVGMPSKFEKLTINQLKSKLVHAAKRSRELMAPMLYYLRKKIKAQGSRNDLRRKPEGFGQWVEKNLPITRRTADTWADEWAVAQGLKKPPTSRKISKGDGELGDISDGPRKEYFSLNLSLTPSEQEELILAWQVLGEEQATALIYETLTERAKAQGPKTDSFKMELDELKEVGVVSPKKPATSERLTFAEDGEGL